MTTKKSESLFEDFKIAADLGLDENSGMGKAINTFVAILLKLLGSSAIGQQVSDTIKDVTGQKTTTTDSKPSTTTTSSTQSIIDNKSIKRVVLWGDSISVNIAEGMQTVKKSKDLNLEIVNKGVGSSGFFNGIGTGQYQLRPLSELGLNKDTAMVIQVGTNDINRIGSKAKFKNIDEYVKELGKTIDEAKATGATIVLLGVNSPEGKSAKSYSSEEIGKLNEAYRKLAAEKGIKFVDIDSKINGLDLSDGVHLSNKGKVNAANAALGL